MNAMAVGQRMTASEYLAHEFDEIRSELVAGEVVVEEPLALHQIVVMELLVALHAWASQEPGRGVVSMPLDVKLDERNVVGPDLMWYAEG